MSLIINRVPRIFNQYSMTFDGVNEAVLSDTGAYDIDTAVSISFWFKASTPAIQRVVLVARDSTFSVNRDFYVILRLSGRLNFGIWDSGGTATTLVSDTAWDDEQWHHCVCTFDGTTDTDKMKIYIDGSSDGTGTASAPGLRNRQVKIGIGALSGNNGWWLNGKIDEVAIWDSELSSADVTSIYNLGDPADLASYSPMHWYRMGDGATWDGSDWNFTNYGSSSIAASSNNMEEEDRTTDVPRK